MAIIDPQRLNRIEIHPAHQTTVEATYSIIRSDEGTFVQIDTYGSDNRKMKKVSQSLRFNRETAKFFTKVFRDTFGNLDTD